MRGSSAEHSRASVAPPRSASHSGCLGGRLSSLLPNCQYACRWSARAGIADAARGRSVKGPRRYRHSQALHHHRQRTLSRRRSRRPMSDRPLNRFLGLRAGRSCQQHTTREPPPFGHSSPSFLSFPDLARFRSVRPACGLITPADEGAAGSADGQTLAVAHEES